MDLCVRAWVGVGFGAVRITMYIYIYLFICIGYRILMHEYHDLIAAHWAG